jgi:cytochrome c peroxidase
MKFDGRAAFAVVLLSCGCGGEPPEGGLEEAELELQPALSGKDLFTKETFGGNGRTCATCHNDKTGTISSADAAARYAADPTDPLFRPLDSDNGAGTSYSRLINHATILVSIPLPPNVTLASDPTQTSVTLERSIPTTFDTPALDPVLMWDGRVATLTEQAKGAILGHAEATDPPDDAEIALIVAFEQKKLFSSKELEKYANKCIPAPGLPQGTTAPELRGRAFFDPTTTPAGLCARCHSGPLLNTPSTPAPGGGPPARFANVRVSVFNARSLPVQTFLFADPGGTVTVVSPDPGRALITGDPKDANRFKIPQLRNIKNTAPYFHDGSAQTLEEVLAHYAQFFAATSNGATALSAQDQADIVAYMKLL